MTAPGGHGIFNKNVWGHYADPETQKKYDEYVKRYRRNYDRKKASLEDSIMQGQETLYDTAAYKKASNIEKNYMAKKVYEEMTKAFPPEWPDSMIRQKFEAGDTTETEVDLITQYPYVAHVTKEEKDLLEQLKTSGSIKHPEERVVMQERIVDRLQELAANRAEKEFRLTEEYHNRGNILWGDPNVVQKVRDKARTGVYKNTRSQVTNVDAIEDPDVRKRAKRQQNFETRAERARALQYNSLENLDTHPLNKYLPENIMTLVKPALLARDILPNLARYAMGMMPTDGTIEDFAKQTATRIAEGVINGETMQNIAASVLPKPGEILNYAAGQAGKVAGKAIESVMGKTPPDLSPKPHATLEEIVDEPPTPHEQRQAPLITTNARHTRQYPKESIRHSVPAITDETPKEGGVINTIMKPFKESRQTSVVRKTPELPHSIPYTEPVTGPPTIDRAMHLYGKAQELASEGMKRFGGNSRGPATPQTPLVPHQLQFATPRAQAPIAPALEGVRTKPLAPPQAQRAPNTIPFAQSPLTPATPRTPSSDRGDSRGPSYPGTPVDKTLTPLDTPQSNVRNRIVENAQNAFRAANAPNDPTPHQPIPPSNQINLQPYESYKPPPIEYTAEQLRALNAFQEKLNMERDVATSKCNEVLNQVMRAIPKKASLQQVLAQLAMDESLGEGETTTPGGAEGQKLLLQEKWKSASPKTMIEDLKQALADYFDIMTGSLPQTKGLETFTTFLQDGDQFLDDNLDLESKSILGMIDIYLLIPGFSTGTMQTINTIKENFLRKTFQYVNAAKSSIPMDRVRGSNEQHQAANQPGQAGVGGTGAGAGAAGGGGGGPPGGPPGGGPLAAIQALANQGGPRGEAQSKDMPNTLRAKFFAVDGTSLRPTDTESILSEMLFNVFTYVPPNGYLGKNKIYQDNVRNKRINMHEPLAFPRTWEPEVLPTPLPKRLAPIQPYSEISQYFKARTETLSQPVSKRHTVLKGDLNSQQSSRNLNNEEKPSFMHYLIDTSMKPIPIYDTADVLKGKVRGKPPNYTWDKPRTWYKRPRHVTTTSAQEMLFKNHNYVIM